MHAQQVPPPSGAITATPPALSKVCQSRSPITRSADARGQRPNSATVKHVVGLIANGGPHSSVASLLAGLKNPPPPPGRPYSPDPAPTPAAAPRRGGAPPP